jgi:hypothetical protein
MLDSFRLRLLPVFGLLLAGYLLISPRLAHAQVAEGENKWVLLDITAVINTALGESKEGVELREKVVRRFAECSLMYGGLATLASNAEAKKNYVQAQLATMEIESRISGPLQSEKRLGLEEAARTSVATVLRALKAQGGKEVAPLLKSCKSFNDVNEVSNAMRELSRQ